MTSRQNLFVAWSKKQASCFLAALLVALHLFSSSTVSVCAEEVSDAAAWFGGSSAEFQLEFLSQEQGVPLGISFQLPLPGYRGGAHGAGSSGCAPLVTLRPASPVKQLSIPVLNSSFGAKHYTTLPLFYVTDEFGLYGVVAVSSEGLFGTLIEQSADNDGGVWEISPVLGVSEQFSGRHIVRRLHRPREVVPVAASKDQRIRINRVSSWRKLEISVVVPSAIAASRSEDSIVSEVVSTIAATGVFFEPMGILLEVTGIEIITDSKHDPYSAAARTRDPLIMLDTARRLWAGRTSPQRDIVVLFAGGKFNSASGLAYPGTACVDSEHSIIFVSRPGGGGESRGLAATLAHELGHFFGLSHDVTYYTDGPSVMWPYSSAAPFGFSARSIDEYFMLAGPGTARGACLSESNESGSQTNVSGVGSNPVGESLSFAGSPKIKLSVAEGDLLVHQFVVVGAVNPLSFVGTNLPPGAQLDPHTGVLVYQPDYSTVQRSRRRKVLKSTVYARSTAAQTSTAVEFSVSDANRPPQFVSPQASELVVRAGEIFELQIQAVDLDEADRLKLRIANSRAVKALPGRPRIDLRNGTARLKWRVRSDFSGYYAIIAVATDRAGASTSRTIVLNVQPPLE